MRGSLFLPPKVHPADYPAPVVLTDADLDAAAAGALVTKVIYLEDPQKAVPVPVPPNGPEAAQASSQCCGCQSPVSALKTSTSMYTVTQDRHRLSLYYYS